MRTYVTGVPRRERQREWQIVSVIFVHRKTPSQSTTEMVKPPVKRGTNKLSGQSSNPFTYTGQGPVKGKKNEELAEEIRREHQPNIRRFVQKRLDAPAVAEALSRIRHTAPEDRRNDQSAEHNDYSYNNLDQLPMIIDDYDDIDEEIQAGIQGRTNETNRKLFASN